MTRSDSTGALARVVLTALLVGLFGVALFLAALPAPPPGAGTSALSVERDGRRAAFLLLDEPFARGALSAKAPEIWRSAPARLPGGRHLLVLSPFEERTRTEDDPSRSAGRLRDPLHYRRFLEQGGTILSGFDEPRGAFFTEELGLGLLAGLGVRERRLARPRDTPQLILADGERLRPEARRWSVFTGRPRTSDVETLAQDADGEELILAVRVGRGRLVLVADDELFGNRRIEDGDNALLFLRTLALVGPFERVLFDEYALGAWSPDTPMDLALSQRPRVLTLHLLAFGALLVWLGLAPRPFPRDPVARVQRTALARAEGLAGLLLSARRFGLLARLLREGTARRLAARLGLSGKVEEEADRERLVGSLQAVLDAEVGAEAPSARALLLERPVRSAEQLDALGLELARLEQLGSARAGGRRAVRRRPSLASATQARRARPSTGARM